MMSLKATMAQISTSTGPDIFCSGVSSLAQHIHQRSGSPSSNAYPLSLLPDLTLIIHLNAVVTHFITADTATATTSHACC